MKNAIKALIVDDHFLFRELIHKVIRHMGVEQITLAQDGTAAIAQLDASIRNQDPFDIIFLDGNMPGMHGNDLVLRIRQSRAYDRSAIVMISAETSRRLIVQAIGNGVSAYLLKPISPAALADRVGFLLDRMDTGHLFWKAATDAAVIDATQRAEGSDAS